MKRLLPPLLLVLFLGFVVWRTAQEPRREAARDRLAGAAGAAVGSLEGMDQLRQDLEAYLENYGRNPDDRRFVARTFIRAGDTARAVEVMWDDPTVRAQPSAGRDLARMMLMSVARLDEEQLTGPERPTNLSTVYLADGGYPEAAEHLTDFFATSPWVVHGPVFLQIALQGEEASRSSAEKALRAREEPQARDSAAILAMRPEAYPQRDTDLERLKDMVTGNLRLEVRDVWAMAAIALGRSGDPEALKLLRETATELFGSEHPPDHRDGAFAALGLVAGGDWSAWSELQPFLDGLTPAPMVQEWALLTIAQRWQAGDEAALEPIQTLWLDESAPDAAGRRLRLAAALFLRGALPAAGDPVGRLAQDLDAPGASSDAKVVGAGVRLRRGEQTARDDLVPHLGAGPQGVPLKQERALVDPLVHSSRVRALRALYLYDR